MASETNHAFISNECLGPLDKTENAVARRTEQLSALLDNVDRLLDNVERIAARVGPLLERLQQQIVDVHQELRTWRAQLSPSTVIAQALAERSVVQIESAFPAPHLARLRVADDGSWFCPPGSETPVSLARNKVLPRLLRTLAEARVRVPGAAQDPAVLIAAAWPGETIRHDAAKTRLYNAIATLRKMGLELICRPSRGYFLSDLVACELQPAHLLTVRAG